MVISNSKYRFINSSGEFIPGIEFDYVGEWHDGLAWAQTKSDYCYINRRGEVVIPGKFSLATNFDNGIATVTLNGKSGCIDTKGTFFASF